MHPLAITLVVVSASFHAARELITKRAHDKQIFIWLVCLCAIVLLCPIVVYEWWQGNVTPIAIALCMLGGIVHSFYWYFMTRAYEDGDLSHVYPIMRSAPALVFVLSVMFLHETASVAASVGVIAITFGIYMINMKKISLQGFLEPLESFKERHTRYALLTAATVTYYSIQDKIMVSHVAPLLYSYCTILFPFLYWTPFVLRTKSKEAIRHEWNARKLDCVINAIIAFVSYTLILYVLTFERVSYVTALRQISIVFGVILGGHLLKERHKWIRLSAAGMIFTGTVMIAFAH